MAGTAAVNVVAVLSPTVVDKPPELRVDKLIELGRRLRHAGRYAKAERLLKRALAIAEEAFGPESIEVAGVLNHLGMLGKYAGHFNRSDLAFRRALRIVGGSDHVLVADLNHNLGGLEHARRNFAKGEPFARRSIEVRTHLLGADHPDTARDLAALAALLDGQGRFKESEPLYARAISILDKSPGRDGFELAVILNNLGALYIATGRRNEAEEFYRRSLAIKKRTLGSRHPEIAITLNNLAVFYRSQGKHREAVRLYRRAIALFENTVQPSHPNLIACRANYAMLQRRCSQ